MLVFTSYLKNKFGKTIHLIKRVNKFIVNKNKSNMRKTLREYERKSD